MNVEFQNGAARDFFGLHSAFILHASSMFLLCGVLGGYLLLMLTNPVRESVRDGLRCVRRYRTMWTALALFGFCYALFQLGVRVMYQFVLPAEDRPGFQWHREAWNDPQLWLFGSSESLWHLPKAMLTGAIRESILPMLEGVAGVFNNVVTTYPFSAVAALLFLVNWGRHHGVLNRTLVRRFGARGWLIDCAISLCAVAALVKPALYGALPALGRSGWSLTLLQAASVIDWLSFLFEYLFGVCIQLYLLLLAFIWVRGINFTREHLLDFAIRRFGFVVKWAGVVMVMSTLFIHLPLILSNVPPFARWMPTEQTVAYIDRVARPILAVFLIFFSTVQITLTFHSESLRKALRDHFDFARRHWRPLSWFLVIAAIHFFLLNLLNLCMVRGLGEEMAVTVAWRLFYPLLAALVAAWMLATWVCVFKRNETGRVLTQDWFKF